MDEAVIKFENLKVTLLVKYDNFGADRDQLVSI
jgi:hypothetical protein